jgi:DNA-binding transcriptional LysR family regulator
MPAALNYRPLQKEPLMAAVPEAWDNSGRLTVVEGALRGTAWMAEPLIIFPARVSPDFHDLVLGYYRSKGHQPFIRQEAIQMQTIISLVSAGLGMALVPASLIHLARTGVRYLPIADDTPDLEIGIAWRRADTAPTLEALLTIASRLDLDRHIPNGTNSNTQT